MLRKIRKLIFHPNRYFYDYFRKKLGFSKYFVTDKIRLLDTGNHQKWHKVLFSHPYLYLYYKFNKRLRKPSYPILVDYRIENIEKRSIGWGKRVVLTVELERKNIIYFADPEIVLKALSGKEPYLAGKIFKINFQGSDNSVFIDGGVRFGRSIKIDVIGDNNSLHISKDCRLISGTINLPGSSNTIFLGSEFDLKGGNINIQGKTNHINFGNKCTIDANSLIISRGDGNTLEAKNDIICLAGSKIIFNKNDNFAYIGSETKISSVCRINFHGSNALLYICGQSTLNLSNTILTSNTMLFYGYGSSIGSNFSCSIYETKNIIIGSDCMFSHFLHFRNATGHAIYDGLTKERTSRGKSIIIGDHVWIGYGVRIMKGVNIHEGSMIGADSFLVKDIPEKCMAAGAPAKVIRENILWSRKGPCDANEDILDEFEVYQEPLEKPKQIGWDNLIKIDNIPPFIASQEKVNLIKQIINDGE